MSWSIGMTHSSSADKSWLLYLQPWLWKSPWSGVFFSPIWEVLEKNPEAEAGQREVVYLHPFCAPRTVIFVGATQIKQYDDFHEDCVPNLVRILPTKKQSVVG
jgi:hypothetical protein